MRKFLIKNKYFTFLFFLTILIFIIGLLLPSILDNNTKNEIIKNLNSFINTLTSNKLEFKKYFITEIKNSFFLLGLIWILGISVIGIPIVLFLYLSKVLILGLETSFFILNIGKYNIMVFSVYIIPKIIYILVLFLLIYYSINFSYLLIKLLFLNQKINSRGVMIRYLKILLILIIVVFINCIIEYFLYYNVLKLFIT